MSKCDFNKVAKQLRHGCSPVNFLHIFTRPFPRNTSDCLLVYNVLTNALLSIFCCLKS